MYYLTALVLQGLGSSIHPRLLSNSTEKSIPHVLVHIYSSLLICKYIPGP